MKIKKVKTEGLGKIKLTIDLEEADTIQQLLEEYARELYNTEEQTPSGRLEWVVAHRGSMALVEALQEAEDAGWTPPSDTITGFLSADEVRADHELPFREDSPEGEQELPSEPVIDEKYVHNVLVTRENAKELVGRVIRVWPVDFTPPSHWTPRDDRKYGTSRLIRVQNVRVGAWIIFEESSQRYAINPGDLVIVFGSRETP